MLKLIFLIKKVINNNDYLKKIKNEKKNIEIAIEIFMITNNELYLLKEFYIFTYILYQLKHK